MCMYILCIFIIVHECFQMFFCWFPSPILQTSLHVSSSPQSSLTCSCFHFLRIKCSFHFCQLTLQKGCADTAQVIAHKCQWIPSRKLTYAPLKVAVQKMFLLFHRWDMEIYGICSQEGILNSILPPWDQRFRTSSPWSLLTWLCRPCSFFAVDAWDSWDVVYNEVLIVYLYRVSLIRLNVHTNMWYIQRCLACVFMVIVPILYRACFLQTLSLKSAAWHDMVFIFDGHIISLLGKKRHDLHFWWLAWIGWMVLWWYTYTFIHIYM